MFRLVFALFVLLSAALASAQENYPFEIEPVAEFDQPWAMAFLPDGRLLVTEKPGRLFVVAEDGSKTAVSGVPDVDYGGQGGLGDVALHPDFTENRWVYLSYAEAGMDGTRGAAVARGVLDLTSRGGKLSDLEVIWRQYPKVVGYGHYGHRLLFSADGHLFISSGERQEFDPAQDMQSNLGKIVRLNDDGSVPSDNPFADQGGVTAQIWTSGHRNPLGIAFDLEGRLWNTEMGPRGGDELNLVIKGENYGYPEVSNGRHYSFLPIPDHDTRPEFAAPAVQAHPPDAPPLYPFVFIIIAMVATGIAVAIPEGHAGFVTPRSGLAARHGISVVNGPGLVDAGYRGEIKVILVNLSNETFQIERGDRIAQLVVIPVAVQEFVEVAVEEGAD